MKPTQKPDCNPDVPASFAALIGSATYNLTDHPQTPKQFREKAEALWQLLDDISTAFDMYKPAMEGFERYVWFKCGQRSKQFQCDGYKLYATESPNAKGQR